jgi:uncharacterized protein (DUF2237 family)
MKKIILFAFVFLTISAVSAQSKVVKKKKNASPNACLAMPSSTESMSKNVLGTQLQACCTTTMTGFYRNGRCETGPNDAGVHVVCAQVTDAFLQYSKSRGNDLMTPFPAYGFAGLKAGDKWCLCASRWREAYEAGVAPPVFLASTHENALMFVSLEALQKNAIDFKSH